MKALVLFITGLGLFGIANAKDGEKALNKVCKVECPNAKDEEEAMKCLKDVVAKKKDDKKFRKSDCHAAFKEHSSHDHGKEDGHQH